MVQHGNRSRRGSYSVRLLTDLLAQYFAEYSAKHGVHYHHCECTDEKKEGALNS